MSNIYSALAPFYDSLMVDVDYGAFADYITSLFSHTDRKIERILDIGCGSGSLTIELEKRGYRMIGADISSEMLALADRKSRDAGFNIQYVCRDMRDITLANKVDAVVSCLDSINYLTHGLNRCFRSVFDCLNSGGLFIFDVNTPEKFRTVYGQHDYLLENEGVTLAWQNDFNEESKICEFYLSFFIEQPDGSYIRRDETQYERMYSYPEIRAALLRAGLLPILEEDRFDGRRHFVAKKV